MDIYSIKSDLQAMEMELNYNDLRDDYVFNFEEMANSKTPKTSHSSHDTKQGERNGTVRYSNYVSLELIEESIQNQIDGRKYIQKNEFNDEKEVHSEQSVIKLNKFYGRTSQKVLASSKGYANQVDSKMMKFPTLKAFNGCNSIFVTEESKNDYYSLLNTVVRIKIKLSNRANCEFSQPGNVIIAREEEMKQIINTMNATNSNIPQQWSGSLIMQRLVEKMPLTQKQISIVLEPEESDCSIDWSPSLKKSILTFYRSGIISVFNDCSARDLILALQFLGLVYTQNQLTFESFGTYLRFKLWRDYVSYRKEIATWVKKRLMRYHSQHQYLFVTHPETLTYASFYLEGKKCIQLDGGLRLHLPFENSEETEIANSCTVVHDLFSGDSKDPAQNRDSRYSNQLRDDFRLYLQQELPGVRVSFSLQKVTMSLPSSSSVSSEHTLNRPVLKIELGEKSYPKNFRFQDLPTNKDISLFNRLDVSSLTDYDSLVDTEEDEPGNSIHLPRRLITVDTLNAEWLLNVFTCKSPTF